MPVYRKSDKKGSYYQYGTTGSKYYYKAGDEKSRLQAVAKAQKQMRAIHVNK
jgi:hypothetical protein